MAAALTFNPYPGIMLRLCYANSEWCVKCSTSVHAPPLTLSRDEATILFDMCRDLDSDESSLEFETIVRLSPQANLTVIHTHTTIHVERREVNRDGRIIRRPFTINRTELETTIVALRQMLHTASELCALNDKFSVERFRIEDHRRPLSVHYFPTQPVPHYAGNGEPTVEMAREEEPSLSQLLNEPVEEAAIDVPPPQPMPPWFTS